MSFARAAPPVWNALPFDLRASESLGQFYEELEDLSLPLLLMDIWCVTFTVPEPLHGAIWAMYCVLNCLSNTF